MAKKKESLDFDFFSNTIPDRELVKPRLSNWDKRSLWESLKKDTEMKEVKMDQLPQFLANDTYQFFNNPIEGIKMDKIDSKNKWQFDFLNKINNTYLRTITERNMAYSYIVTREYMRMLYRKVEEEQKKNPGKSPEEIIKDWIESDEEGKGDLKQAIARANREIDKKIEEHKKKCDMGAGKEDVDNWKEMEDQFKLMSYLSHINLSSRLIQDFIKTSLKLSSSHFSSKYTETEESFLEADLVEDLFDMQYLLPVFRNLHLDDVQTPKKKYHLNFDIYIDISGSMENGIQMGNTSITALDLCKLTALKLLSMGYGKNIYFFNTRVFEVDKDKLIKARSDGGTTTNNVVKHIIKTNRPGLILTDMCDTIDVYSENAYFIGVNGANFNGLVRDAKAFLTKGQVVKYENNTFKKA